MCVRARSFNSSTSIIIYTVMSLQHSFGYKFPICTNLLTELCTFREIFWDFRARAAAELIGRNFGRALIRVNQMSGREREREINFYYGPAIVELSELQVTTYGGKILSEITSIFFHISATYERIL